MLNFATLCNILQHFATLFYATLFEFLWYKMDIIAGSASEILIFLLAIMFVMGFLS